ncbi:MAG TPA: hypothetical protein VIG06_11080 [Kofleriaceae bacterium]
MRLAWVLAVAVCGGCAGGAASDPGAPDGGGRACETSQECDDGDRCTAEACDQATGTCLASPIDWCADATPIVDEDFESRPDRPINHAFLDAAEGEDGWRSSPAPGCPVGVATVVDDDFEAYGKPAAFVSGEGGWLFTNPGGASVSLVGSPDGGSGYAMQVLGTTASGSYGQAVHLLTPQASGWVDLRVRAPGNFKTKYLQLVEEGDTRVHLIFDADGQIKYSSGGTPVALRGYVADVWYPVRIEWDAASDRASISIDGDSHPDLALHAPIGEYVDSVRLKTATASGLSFWVDDVRASGGEDVDDGAGSLRVGAAQASCQATARATLAFPTVRGGSLEVDVMADGSGGPHELRLVDSEDIDGDTGGERIALSLEEGGGFAWTQGGVTAALPVDARWSPGDWIHLSIRWQGAIDAVDVAVGEDPPAIRLQPAAPIVRGVDRLRLVAPAGGALFIDDLRISAAEP